MENIKEKLRNVTDAYFIKLGKGGHWEETCIEKDQTIRLGFGEVPHELCFSLALNGKSDWTEIDKYLVNAEKKEKTKIRNQIKRFYTADENVLWITFYAGKLWWCFAHKEVAFHSDDNSKTRAVIGIWSSSDILGDSLDLSRLSGKLISVQRFQGTSCSIKEKKKEYLIQKITGLPRGDVVLAKKAQTELQNTIKAIIEELTPKDFEILMDLIFRETGWRRSSVLGETQKTLDLDLFSPITGEKFGIQIKSTASKKEFEQFLKETNSMPHDKFFFAVHSPKGLLKAQETGRVKLLLLDEIASLTVKYGLADWVIDKAG